MQLHIDSATQAAIDVFRQRVKECSTAPLDDRKKLSAALASEANAALRLGYHMLGCIDNAPRENRKKTNEV